MITNFQELLDNVHRVAETIKKQGGDLNDFDVECHVGFSTAPNAGVSILVDGIIYILAEVKPY